MHLGLLKIVVHVLQVGEEVRGEGGLRVLGMGWEGLWQKGRRGGRQVCMGKEAGEEGWGEGERKGGMQVCIYQGCMCRRWERRTWCRWIETKGSGKLSVRAEMISKRGQGKDRVVGSAFGGMGGRLLTFAWLQYITHSHLCIPCLQHYGEELTLGWVPLLRLLEAASVHEVGRLSLYAA